ncbi:MAG: hypothetical protein AB7T27_01455 [Kiritimatiellia bacterium]
MIKKLMISFLLAFAACSAAQAARWTLVDFGSNLTTCVTPYAGWTNIMRHPSRTQFVSPDGDPDHDGITITDGLGETEPSYFGIRGSSPINFQPGHEIICTFYNRTDSYPYPTVRISFTDTNEPDSEDPSNPWFTAYNSAISINTAWVEPYSLVEMRYYIQDEDMLAAIDGIVTTGQHYMVNVNFAWFGTDEPELVLTKIEFSDEADLTAPSQPSNVRAELVGLTSGAVSNVVKLRWSPSSDPGANATGVSRYYIYRNGALYDFVSEEMTAHLGTNLFYLDLTAAPGTSYVYQVAALDKAQYGLYPRLGRPPCHPANESAWSDPLVVTTPVWQSSTLVNPWTDFDYAGGFRLPRTANYDWAYASAGLAWYPHGNSGYDPTNELPGSLYALTQTQRGIGSFNIPKPVISTNIADLPTASALIAVNTNIWPAIYGGNTYPAGGADWPVASLAYHPGGSGVTGRLYYGICNFFETDASAPSHGWMDLGLAAGHGAWHIGGLPPTNVCPSLTARYACPIPQAWADLHTGGRSLLIGNNFLSGGPQNNNGPNVYAIAPWASGLLPTNGAMVPATRLLQYSPIATISNQVPNWRIDRNAEGAAWLEVNEKSALAISYRRPMGDGWYGDTAGNNFTFYNIPLPPTGEEGAGATMYHNELLLFNPDDLAAVAAGTMEPWEPQPYLSYDLAQFSFVTNVPAPASGAICFTTNGYLFWIEPNGDVDEIEGENGLIHVWRADAGVFQPSLSIRMLSGGLLELMWDTQDDKAEYQLQSSAGLLSGSWTNSGTSMTGDGGSKAVTNIPTGSAGFYRVSCEP